MGRINIMSKTHTELLKQLSKNLFLDTQVFVRNKLLFESKSLNHLCELSSDSAINVFITEIVDEEVKNQLNNRANELFQLLKNYQRKSQHLKGQSVQKIDLMQTKITKEEFIDVEFKKWADFKKKCNIQILKATEIDGSSLIAMYFKGMAPFSVGKKKDEFPDAISTLCISKFIVSKVEKINVVSDDKDFKLWADNQPAVSYFKSLAEFIDLFSQKDDLYHAQALNLIKIAENKIKEKIDTQFPECYFDFVDSFESVVISVTVRDINFKKINIINASKNDANYSIDTEIDFDILLEYPDYESGIWDSEEKQYWHLPVETRVVDFNETYELNLTLEHKDLKSESIKISDIIFNDDNEISLYENDENHQH
jgi:hypothetical protein